MTALNWDAERTRRKAALIRAAAGDMPRTITARFRGQCHVCKQWWNPGARLARTYADRWAHADCAARDNAQSRLAERRARLKATKGTAAH